MRVPFLRKMPRVGLLPKLVLGIAAGILIGAFLPVWVTRLVVTLSTLYSTFLQFFIPLMILAFVTMGVADLGKGAGAMLGVTTGISYASSLLAGLGAYFFAKQVFPGMMDASLTEPILEAQGKTLESLIVLDLPPVINTMSAVALAFILGLALSTMRGKTIGDSIYNAMKDFSVIVQRVLQRAIIPFLPLYICGTFAQMTYAGETLIVFQAMWPVFLCIIGMHLVYLLAMFSLSGAISGRNPFRMLANQVPGYTTALGTQSSAATIPVNLHCAEKNGIPVQIRNFVIPLCANIHMAGDMITIASLVTATLLLFDMQVTTAAMVAFIATLGVATIAAPGVPGGAIMTALPFMATLGIAANSPMASLLITLFVAQDSFGTACNVSGDNAVAAIVERYAEARAARKGRRASEGAKPPEPPDAPSVSEP